MKYPIHHDFSLFTDYDIYLFKEGKHTELYKKFGAHIVKNDNKEGVYFSVWAPNAKSVSVRGDFNNYDTDSHPLKLREDESGIWEGFIEGIKQGLT